MDGSSAVSGTAHVNDDVAFVARVCTRFGLGRLQASPRRILGWSNRLLVVDTTEGRFVIKEFPARGDASHVTERSRATAFERHVWAARDVPMPRPIVTANGRVIAVVPGPRSGNAAVRVHEWAAGHVLVAPSTDDAFTAGRLLARIHRHGIMFATAPVSGFGARDVGADAVVRALQRAELVTPAHAATAHREIDRAQELITCAEDRVDRWVFSHFDLKPENCLGDADGLCVLDWDEARLSAPRVEVVEAALSWAGARHADADPVMFTAFLEGYGAGGRPALDRPIEPDDFAKWLSAGIHWLAFNGRRALGTYDDSPAEREVAASEAIQAIERLGRTLASLDRWCTLAS
jgi:Ser/Thr protein kinase RdoA (MazF antagonist)